MGRVPIGSDRPLFHVPLDLLPPVPWQNGPAHGARPTDVLEELLAAAGTTVIAPLAVEPDAPSLGEGLDAIKAAGAAYDVAPGIALSDYLWTHYSALRSGEIAACLRNRRPDGRQTRAFLLIYATEIRGPLVYVSGTSPLRVRRLIGQAIDVEGPHLALVVLKRSADGRAEPALAVATPVYRARRLMPVRSALDRDVLRALEHFRVAVDAYGIDCQISRSRPATPFTPTRLELDLTWSGSPVARAILEVDPDAAKNRPSGNRNSAHFVVCERTWRDGSLTEWLRRIIRG